MLAGVDALARTWVYIITMIAFMSICGGTYLGFTWLNVFIQRNIRQRYIQIEQFVLSALSGCTIVTLLFAIVTTNALFATLSKILLVLIGLTFLMMFFEIVSFHGKDAFLTRCRNDAASIFGLSWMNAYIHPNIRQAYLHVEQSVLATLANFTAVTFLFAITTANEFLVAISKILLAFVGLTFLLMIFKVLSFHRHKVFLECYRNNAIIVCILTLGYVLFFVRGVMFDLELIIAFRHIVVFFLIVIGFLSIYPILLHKLSLNSQKVNAALIFAGMPLALIPCSLPFVNELQFTLSGRRDLSPRSLALIVIGCLLVLSIIGFVIFIRRVKLCRRPSRIIKYWYFPAFLASMYLFKAYEHVVIFAEPFDLNHQAEPLVPIQQFFSFGSLPFVDILPTHGISDIFSSMLYSLVNGYRGLEILLWEWLVGLIAFLLMYGLLARLITPLFSLCAMLLLPIETLFHSYYAMFLLPCLLLSWVMKHPTVFRYFLLWISVLWVFVWRSDFGVAAIGSCLFIMPGVYVYHKTYHPRWSWTKGVILPILTLCGVFGMAVIAYGVIIHLRGRSVIDVFAQFQHFGKDMIRTHSYALLFTRLAPFVCWQYIGVPLVSMSYMICFAVRVCTKNIRLSCVHVILTNLAAFSLIMSVRSVHRHSLMEGYNPYLAAFLLCMLPWFFISIKRRYAELFFLSMFILYFFAFSVRVPIGPDALITRYARQDALFAFRQWRNKPERVIVTDQSQYAGLMKFFNATMTKEQTFLDFASAPMLYVLTGRQCPAYYHQIIAYTTDSVQQYLLKLLTPFRQTGRLPFVIFKQNSWWDGIDGVPQEIRSYRMTEFIYRYYQPFAMVNNYEIWKERGFDVPNAITDVFPLSYREKTNFRYDDMTLQQETDGTLMMRTGGERPQVMNVLDIGTGFLLSGEKQYALKMMYTSSVNGTLETFFDIAGNGYHQQDGIRCAIVDTDSTSECVAVIPKSERAAWLRNVRFKPPKDAVLTIHKIEMCESSTMFIPLENRPPQQFDLKQLPYLWGMYDEQGAAQATEALETVMLPSLDIEPNLPVVLAVTPNIDKTSGNYLHFEIRSDQNGEVIVRYGTGMANTISFDVLASPNNEVDYLVRISMQWAWMSQPISRMTIESSVPLRMTQLMIRKGD